MIDTTKDSPFMRPYSVLGGLSCCSRRGSLCLPGKVGSLFHPGGSCDVGSASFSEESCPREYDTFGGDEWRITLSGNCKVVGYPPNSNTLQSAEFFSELVYDYWDFYPTTYSGTDWILSSEYSDWGLRSIEVAGECAVEWIGDEEDRPDLVSIAFMAQASIDNGGAVGSPFGGEVSNGFGGLVFQVGAGPFLGGQLLLTRSGGPAKKTYDEADPMPETYVLDALVSSEGVARFPVSQVAIPKDIAVPSQQLSITATALVAVYRMRGWKRTA